MQKSQTAVTEFMRLYGQALPAGPTIPDDKTRMMRVNSLAEEVGELAQASGVILVLTAHPAATKPTVEVSIYPDAIPQLDQIADALVDAQYFVDGTANAYGLDLEPLFDEVHRANMGKLWSAGDLKHMEPEWSASAFVPNYGNGKPTSTPVADSGWQRFVVKRPDGKVMKPPGYKLPNIHAVVESQKCRHEGFNPDKVNPHESDLADPNVV